MGIIGDSLSVNDNHLFIEQSDTTQLVEEFGSPSFVISENQLRRNFQRYHNAFTKHWPFGAVDILPANQAIWKTAVRSVLSEEGAGAS